MNIRAALKVIVFVVFVIGFTSAHWMVQGDCDEGSSVITAATVYNGNCAPLERSWALINATSNSIDVSYCNDAACKDCSQFHNWPIVKFVDCKTTREFKYPTKINPESDIIKRMGGAVWGIADTFDNCNISAVLHYFPANRCITYPSSSKKVICSPDNPSVTFNYYDDATCNHKYKEIAIKLDNSCFKKGHKEETKRDLGYTYEFCAYQN